MAYGNDYGTQDVSSIFAGADTGGTSDENVLAERTARLANQVPQDLIGAYNNIAKNGIYGKVGVDSIMRALRTNSMLRRSMAARAARASLGRRLGARSGAVDTMLTNELDVPALANEQGQYGNLLASNLESRTSVGTAGLRSLADLFNNQYQNRMQREAAKPGVMDYIGAGAKIASSIF